MRKIIIPALLAMTFIACDDNSKNEVVEEEIVQISYPVTFI